MERAKESNEKAYNDQKNNCIIECSKKYLRPAEVDYFEGRLL